MQPGRGPRRHILLRVRRGLGQTFLSDQTHGKSFSVGSSRKVAHRRRARVVRHGALGERLRDTQNRRCEMVSAIYRPRGIPRGHVPHSTNVHDSLTSRLFGLAAVTSVEASAAKAIGVIVTKTPSLMRESKRASVDFIVATSLKRASLQKMYEKEEGKKGGARQQLGWLS